MSVDSSLLKACMNGKEQAQEELYKILYQPLLGIGLRYMKNRTDAASVMNQSFIKIINALPKYKHSHNFEAWAKRIMVNTCIDELRKIQTKNSREYPFDPSDYVYRSGTIDWNAAEANLNEAAILEMVQNLPDKTREVFNLYVIEGFQHNEISDVLNVSEGTSKWHLSKARKILQDRIKKTLKSKKLSSNAS